MPCESPEWQTPEARCPPLPTTADQRPPPASFPAGGQLRPHLSAGDPAALTSKTIPAAALWNRLNAGKKLAETRPGPFPSSPPPTHLGSSGAGSSCSCHSLTLTNRRGHRGRRPLHSACGTSAESSGAGSEETGSRVVLALDGPSLPQSGSARPHLDGASTLPWRPPPPLSRSLAPPLPLRP